MNGTPSSTLHLVRRFFWSLGSGEPESNDEQWLLSLLSERERQLYAVSSRQDRRHAVDCALRAQAILNECANDQATFRSDRNVETNDHARVIAAAALHDVGKTPARLSTFGRVLATIAKPIVSERADLTAPTSWWQRLGVYKAHPEIGAQLLAGANSDPLVVAWAREHHRGREERSIDEAIAAILEQAD